MDILKPFVKHFTFDFFMKRDGYNVACYERDLLTSQFQSAEKIRELQLEKTKQLLSYCRDKNEYYRQRFAQAGIEPESIRSLDDIARLPVLTKDDIRTAGDALFSDSFTRTNSVHNRTGGSTGVPLHTYMDYPAVSFKKAATLRHNSWAHLARGDRLAAVWGDTDKPQPFKTRMRNHLTDRAFYLDTLKFDE